MSSPVVSQLKVGKEHNKAKQALFISEGGNEDVLSRVRNGANITDSQELAFDNGTTITTVTDLGSDLKEIVTASDLDGRVKKIQSKVRLTSGVSFNYGLFTGQGGLDIDNNSRINGSVYSNGDIIGAGGATIAGDVYVAMRPATTTDVEWITYNDDLSFGLRTSGQNQIDITQSFKVVSSNTYLAKIALYLKKVGTPTNLDVFITEDKSGKPNKNGILATGVVASNLVESNYSFVDIGFDNNPQLDPTKTYWIVLNTSRDDNNYYVNGFDNVDGYSDGSGFYSNDWTKSSFTSIGGDLNFKVWMSNADSSGTLNNIIVDDGVGGIFSAYAHNILNSDISGDAFAYTFDGSTADGDVSAHNISDCTIGGDADYNISTNCSIGGSETSPTIPPTDPSYLVYPISESNIDTWKAEAIANGVISVGDLYLSDGDSIGPGVVEGDLYMTAGGSFSLEGTVYVKGNMDISGNADFGLGLSYGSDGSGAIISDGWINLENNVAINYPRTNNGHMMMLSLAECDQYYGFTTCTPSGYGINISNNVAVDILVAPYGTIRLNNNITAISLVGDQLSLNNNIELNYEQGLTNMNFSSGPSGSWSIESWREIE